MCHTKWVTWPQQETGTLEGVLRGWGSWSPGFEHSAEPWMPYRECRPYCGQRGAISVSHTLSMASYDASFLWKLNILMLLCFGLICFPHPPSSHNIVYLLYSGSDDGRQNWHFWSCCSQDCLNVIDVKWAGRHLEMFYVSFLCIFVHPVEMCHSVYIFRRLWNFRGMNSFLVDVFSLLIITEVQRKWYQQMCRAFIRTPEYTIHLDKKIISQFKSEYSNLRPKSVVS